MRKGHRLNRNRIECKSHKRKLVREVLPDILALMVSDPSKQLRKRAIARTLLYIEGAVLLALALWLIELAFTHEDTEILPLLGVILFAVAGGVGLIACGRGFAQGKRYARGPSVLANLIALGVAYYQFGGGFYIGAIPILILAVSTLYCALTIIPEENGH